jgi:hypothetical protein
MKNDSFTPRKDDWSSKDDDDDEFPGDDKEIPGDDQLDDYYDTDLEDLFTALEYLDDKED